MLRWVYHFIVSTIQNLKYRLFDIRIMASNFMHINTRLRRNNQHLNSHLIKTPIFIIDNLNINLTQIIFSQQPHSQIDQIVEYKKSKLPILQFIYIQKHANQHQNKTIGAKFHWKKIMKNDKHLRGKRMLTEWYKKRKINKKPNHRMENIIFFSSYEIFFLLWNIILKSKERVKMVLTAQYKILVTFLLIWNFKVLEQKKKMLRVFFFQ